VTNQELLNQLSELANRQEQKGYCDNAKLIREAHNRIKWYHATSTTLAKQFNGGEL